MKITTVHYLIPIMEQGAYQELGETSDSYPVTKKICAEEVGLPLYPGMTEEPIEWVIECVNNSIAKLFELEDIILQDVSTTNDEVHVFFSLQRKVHSCPFCHALTDKVHDYRTSVIKDLPFMGKESFLHYRKRRYHCPCCNKNFYETFPLLPKY